MLTPQFCGPPYACSRVLLPPTYPKAAPSQHHLPITMFSVRVQIYSVNADTHVIRHASSSHTFVPSGYCGTAWHMLHRSAGPSWAFTPTSATVKLFI